MSDKTHCDLCDVVIDADVERLTLKVGTAINNTFREEENAHDICPGCVGRFPLLAELLREFKG